MNGIVDIPQTHSLVVKKGKVAQFQNLHSRNKWHLHNTFFNEKKWISRYMTKTRKHSSGMHTARTSWQRPPLTETPPPPTNTRSSFPEGTWDQAGRKWHHRPPRKEHGRQLESGIIQPPSPSPTEWQTDWETLDLPCPKLRLWAVMNGIASEYTVLQARERVRWKVINQRRTDISDLHPCCCCSFLPRQNCLFARVTRLNAPKNTRPSNKSRSRKRAKNVVTTPHYWGADPGFPVRPSSVRQHIILPNFPKNFGPNQTDWQF